MLRVAISDDAEEDLLGIYRKRLELRGPDGHDGAEALLDSLLAAIARIAAYPESGPNVPEIADLSEQGWRQISLRPYRIIYFLSEREATVVMVADSRRDLGSLLQRRLFNRE